MEETRDTAPTGRTNIGLILGILGVAALLIGFTILRPPMNQVFMAVGGAMAIIAVIIYFIRKPREQAEALAPKAKSAVQGGSNFGQGSSQLGSDTHRQGSVKSSGSNYDNEASVKQE